jgi:DNA polymerase I
VSGPAPKNGRIPGFPSRGRQASATFPTGHHPLRKTLVLVDGSSYLYRAFHAMPDLRNAAGEPTGAIYGVLNMLRRLIADFKARNGDLRCACIFDAKGKTFRDDWYPEYKANRPSMPDELAQQIAPLHECIRAMGWPLISVEGVEADDVIGTLARRAEADGMQCVVSTGDKDLAQLVTPHVTLINTMTNERLDVDGVTAKFGVPPERIVDYFSFVGDSVDNVPGVHKVGPKTAVKWLQQYGSLDNVVAHASEIGGVVGENLRKSLDWLPQARRLLTVKCDVDLEAKPESLSLQPRNEVQLGELFARYGFRAWLREVRGEGDAESAGASPGKPDLASPRVEIAVIPTAEFNSMRDYALIGDESELEQWLPRLLQAPLAAFDTETTSLDPLGAKLVGMSFSVEPGRAAYVPLAHDYAGAPAQIGVARAIEILRPWLENARCPKLGQNAKYDQHVLANHGVSLAGVVHDTLLQSYVLESHLRHDMDTLAQRVLGAKTISYDEVTGTGAKRIGFEQVEVGRASQYAAEDADITLQLHLGMYPRVCADERLKFVYESIEMPVREILFRIERNGVLIDAGLLAVQSRELGQKMMPASRSISIHPSRSRKYSLSKRACRW